MDAARVPVRWLLALALTCVLAVRTRPDADLATRPPEAGLAPPASPWPLISRGLAVVRAVVEPGVEAFVDRFIEWHIEDRRPMRARIAELRARKRLLERRIVELRRQIAEQKRHRCGQWYLSNPSATSALDVMRGE